MVDRVRMASRLCSALLATSALAGLAPALAQATDPAAQTTDNAVASPATAPTPAPTDQVASNEIIVTATKRSESLQKVPISIQALSSEALEQHQVKSLDDYVKLLPSISYQSFGPGQSQLSVRGITTGGDGLASGPLPTVGLYVDETPLTTIYGSVDIHPYDLARVEALAGPQGTLYGASSLAGTVRLITNKPDTTRFSGAIDVEGNKFGSGGYGGTVEGYINAPLTDRIALRVVGFYEKEGGYIDNTPTVGRVLYNPNDGTYLANRPYRRTGDAYTADGTPGPLYYTTTALPDDFTPTNAGVAEKNFNDVKTYGGRAALKVDLDDNWTVTPNVIYQHQVSHGSFLYDPRAGDLDVHDFTDEYNKDHWYLASATIQGKLSDWDVTYSGSYFDRHVAAVADYSYFSVAYDQYAGYNFYQDALGNAIDPTQFIATRDHYTKMSHELRVASPAEDRVRLTAGLFMQRQTNTHIADYYIPGISQGDFTGYQIGGAPADDVYYTNIDRKDRDYAAFGEAAFDILPNLTLNAGIRGFIAQNTLNGTSGSASSLANQIAVTGCAGTTVQQCPNIKTKYNEIGETHKVNLTYKIDSDRLVYFTYSTGFRPGGTNRSSIVTINGEDRVQNLPPFQSDTLTNYEVGWKTNWLNRTLRINGALFWEEWNRIQYSQPGILGIFYTVNAGTARSRGVEMDFNWHPDRHFTLSGSGTYADARLTSDFGDDAPKGTRLPVNPKLKLNGTARYDVDLGELPSFVQATVSHQSSTRQYLTDAGEAIIGGTSGFTTFDFSAGTRWGNYTLSAFIQNAFDKRGILSKNGACAPTVCGQYYRLYAIKPQFFGLRAGAKF